MVPRSVRGRRPPFHDEIRAGRGLRPLSFRARSESEAQKTKASQCADVASSRVGYGSIGVKCRKLRLHPSQLGPQGAFFPLNPLRYERTDKICILHIMARPNRSELR